MRYIVYILCLFLFLACNKNNIVDDHSGSGTTGEIKCHFSCLNVEQSGSDAVVVCQSCADSGTNFCSEMSVSDSQQFCSPENREFILPVDPE
jgi:hypothetical protein